MPQVMETVLNPGPLPAGDRDSRRKIYVIFTCHENTIPALRIAGALAERWNARIVVIAPKPVPFPRDVADPDVATEFHERELTESLRQCCVEASVTVFLCRNRAEALVAILPPHSVVVLGVRRRWWRTAEEHIATTMRRAGHDVVIAPVE